MAKQIKKGEIDCTKRIMAVHDAIYILSGRWKISILTSLYYRKMRFMELQREVLGISGKMLSRELKDLEINQLVTRSVLDTQPVTVTYDLTPYGRALEKVINELANWGLEHRKKIFQK
jgi:DNA-binding HxlR family transcriptional regulator